MKGVLCCLVAGVLCSSVRVEAFTSVIYNRGHGDISRSAARASGFSFEAARRLSQETVNVDLRETVIIPRNYSVGRGYVSTVSPGLVIRPTVHRGFLHSNPATYSRTHHFDRPMNMRTPEAFYDAWEYFTRDARDEAINYIRSAQDNDGFVAMGQALHALQDVVSHSNYVNLLGIEQNMIDTLLLGIAPPMSMPARLRLTCFDPTAPEPENPPDPIEQYTHAEKAKDRAWKNGEAMVGLSGNTNFDKAYQAARRLSELLLQYVKARVSAADWFRITHAMSPNGDATALLSGVTHATTGCDVNSGGSVTCNGTTVNLPSATFSRARVTVYSESDLGSLDLIPSEDGFQLVAWTEIVPFDCADTLGCIVNGTMTVTLTDSTLATVDSDTLRAYRFDSDSGWVQIGGAVVNEEHTSVTFGFTQTGMFAVGALPMGDWELSVEEQDWFQDTFSANETYGLPGTAAFDTTAALIKTGHNIASPASAFTNRMNIPGDSVVVKAPGDNIRVDLVFRVLPGPGNYVTIGRGNGSYDVRRVPTNPTAATPGDGSFWGSYLEDNGTYGTPGGHPFGPGGRRWDPNVWNSARMDTAEYNAFPVSDLGITVPAAAGTWSTTYHERDQKFPVLGMDRNRCFVQDLSAAHVVWNCGDLPSSYPPMWVWTLPQELTGWDGQTTTKEGTKILPDGLFTPGTHIEYFFRKENLTTGATFLLPDTNRVFPQIDEGSLDAHRWQAISVLPDRWKDLAFLHPVTNQPGQGKACMLVVDYADGSGDEQVWVSIADSTEATKAERFGAHNGWHATSGQNLNDPATFVRAHLGQAGTTWDLYQVRGGSIPTGFPPNDWPVIVGPTSVASGTIGSRLSAYVPGPAWEKRSRQGPTPEMLRKLYWMLFMMTGDANDGILGPYWNRSQDDVLMLKDWLASNQGTPVPRGLWIMGSGFAESNANVLYGPATQESFMNNWLGTQLRWDNYWEFTGDPAECISMYPLYPISSEQSYYGLHAGSSSSLDVLQPNAGMPEAFTVTRYGDYGPGPFPLASGVLKPEDYPSNRVWRSLVNGFSIQDLSAPYCENPSSRNKYFYDVLQSFQNMSPGGCMLVGSPNYLDVPDPGVLPVAPFLEVRNTPVQTGSAEIHFGLPSDSPVNLAIYDVAGRRIATLVDGVVPAGRHSVSWRGRADAPRAGMGIYFVKYTTSTYASSKKLVLLH